MQEAKVYYFVLEDCGYGDIGSHGHYLSLDEAQKEANRLQDYFPQNYFWVYENYSENEPVIVTI